MTEISRTVEGNGRLKMFILEKLICVHGFMFSSAKLLSAVQCFENTSVAPSDSKTVYYATNGRWFWDVVHLLLAVFSGVVYIFKVMLYTCSISSV